MLRFVAVPIFGLWDAVCRGMSWPGLLYTQLSASLRINANFMGQFILGGRGRGGRGLPGNSRASLLASTVSTFPPPLLPPLHPHCWTHWKIWLKCLAFISVSVMDNFKIYERNHMMYVVPHCFIPTLYSYLYTVHCNLCTPRNETARPRSSFSIPTFVYLWAIYIFLGSIILFRR